MSSNRDWTHVKNVASMREFRLQQLKIENKKFKDIKLQIYPNR